VSLDPSLALRAGNAECPHHVTMSCPPDPRRTEPAERAMHPRHPRILITGFGLVTPLGGTAWETFSALLAGRTLADRAAELPDDTAPVDLVRALGAVVFVQHTSHDPAVDLAERAAREALFMANVPDGVTLPSEQRTRTIVGVSKGCVDALTHAANPPGVGDWRSPNRLAPCLAVTLGPVGDLCYHLKQRLALGDITATVAACASSLTAVHQARQMLLHEPDVRRVLVVTSEAALLPAFIHSYDRLGVLPPLDAARYVARPLDEQRSGFMLAELAAAIVLEREDALPSKSKAPGAVPGAGVELSATAIACEGYDLIRAAPGMPALHRVATGLFSPGPVDVIHPHATGTMENDAAELEVYARAIAGVRGFKPPRLYASKGAIGHGLGASGLVSLVLACLAARAGRVPPMPWLKNPIAPREWMDAGTTTLPASSAHAVFAAGFGGHVAGARIERLNEPHA